MIIYHFTNNGNIEEFRHTKAKNSYSQATGRGIYFTTDYEKGLMKYGRKNKYCYRCEFIGDNILNLGEFDSMYISGDRVHSSDIVSKNFRRYLDGLDAIEEPDIIIEKLSLNAFNWLKKNGIKAITGMYSNGYACPEFCLINTNAIRILDIKQI